MSVGRYQAYPKYKDSGLPWMSEVPAHWTELRFKHVLADKKKTLRPDLPAGSISFGRVVYKDADILSNETKASYQEVLSGEFLVNPLNLNYDLVSLRTALCSIDVVVSTGYIVLQSSGRLNPNYTRWLLQQFDVAHMKTLGAGVRQTINFSDIGNSFFFEPSKSEQIQIAAFLDHQAARIDRLIEQQEALIALLNEKRQAVISHAVTKGIDASATLKASPIAWLRQVPAHWTLARFKHVLSDKKKTPHPELPAGSISFGRVIIKDEEILSKETKASYQEVLAGEFLVNPLNLNYDLVSLRTALSEIDVVVSTGYIVLQNTGRLHPNYTRWLLHEFDVAHMKTLGSGVRQTINYSDIGNSFFFEPPESEQIQIAAFLDHQTAKIDQLIKKQEILITLLQERRTALVSAAVTGKIDVRHWKQPAPSRSAN